MGHYPRLHIGNYAIPHDEGTENLFVRQLQAVVGENSFGHGI